MRIFASHPPGAGSNPGSSSAQAFPKYAPAARIRQLRPPRPFSESRTVDSTASWRHRSSPTEPGKCSYSSTNGSDDAARASARTRRNSSAGSVYGVNGCGTGLKSLMAGVPGPSLRLTADVGVSLILYMPRRIKLGSFSARQAYALCSLREQCNSASFRSGPRGRLCFQEAQNEFTSSPRRPGCRVDYREFQE